MKNLLLSTLMLLSPLTFAATTTADLAVTSVLNSTCSVSAESIDLGSNLTNSNTIINNKFSIICSKGTPVTIGFTSDERDPVNPTSRYLIGSNPANKDKIVYNLGGGLNKFPADGSAAPGVIGLLTGTGSPQQISGLFRIYVIGSIINEQFYSTDFGVKADNYISNVTMTLTY